MAELLYLNKVLVDLKGKSITRKIRIADIGDISARKSTYSYTLKLVRTTKTVQMLDMIGVGGNTSRKPYELVTADYIVDGIPLVQNGYAKISATSSYISVNIYDGVKGLSELLKGKKIADLPLSDLDHYLTTQTYVDSYSNTEGYIYGIANYGLGASENLKVEEQAPSIYTHTLFRKIFESNGLNLVGEFFTSNERYLSEVVTPSKGYTVTDSALTVVGKGDADTDTLSDNKLSGSYLSFVEKFTISTGGLTGASIVGGDIKFSVAGSYKLAMTIASSSYLTYLNLVFKINGIEKATIAIDQGNNKVKDTSVVFDALIDDVVSFELSGSSEYDWRESTGVFQLNYSASFESDLFLQSGGQLIRPTDYIGELGQMEFVKDVVKRYALLMRPIVANLNYEFRRIEALLNDRVSAEDWTGKLSEIKKEGYISGYAKVNKAKYKYPAEIVIPNNDGEMTIENENAISEKTIISSSFEIPNKFSNQVAGNDVFELPIWKDDGGVQNLETPLKVMRVTRKDVAINAKLFTEVTGIDVTEGVPFLSLENMSMQAFIDYFYPSFRGLINSYKELDLTLNLSVIDVYNLDFFKLKYFKQTGRYYYVETVVNTTGKLSKVKAMEILEFPTNQPPSQIGAYSFSMGYTETRAITLSNLLTGYEDPETDAAKKIKILTGFNSDLLLKNNGVTILAETEIDVADLDLTVVEVLNGSDYQKEFTFTIADEGSGLYSEKTGTITVNVISTFVNGAPVADAGSDDVIQFPSVIVLPELTHYLSGAASYDLTGEIVKYEWTITARVVNSTVELNVQDTANPSASLNIPNNPTNEGFYTLQLEVTDEFGLTDTDTMQIEIIEQAI